MYQETTGTVTDGLSIYHRETCGVLAYRLGIYYIVVVSDSVLPANSDNDICKNDLGGWGLCPLGGAASVAVYKLQCKLLYILNIHRHINYVVLIFL